MVLSVASHCTVERKVVSQFVFAAGLICPDRSGRPEPEEGGDNADR